MITVGMNYQVIPGKDDEFTTMFSTVMKVMEDMEGHTVTHLFRDVYSEHEYLVVSEWTDEAAFNAFIASDRFKGVTNWGTTNVLAGRPKHEIYGAAGEVGATGCPV